MLCMWAVHAALHASCGEDPLCDQLQGVHSVTATNIGKRLQLTCSCNLLVLAGDVYFFCGPQMQYCTCGFRWNLAGWSKAFILWNFVLSAALGVQRLIIQLGLCGLLPGGLAAAAAAATR